MEFRVHNNVSQAQFNSLCFGTMHQTDIDYVTERMATVGRHLREDAKWLIDKASLAFDRARDSSLALFFKRSNDSLRGLERKNTIQFLNSYEDISLAPPCMQSLIVIREDAVTLAKKKKLHNYGLKIEDFEFTIKARSTIYNGVTTYEESSERFINQYEYGNTTILGKELLLEEQLDLIATHDLLSNAIAESIDATDVHLESLE